LNKDSAGDLSQGGGKDNDEKAKKMLDFLQEKKTSLKGPSQQMLIQDSSRHQQEVEENSSREVEGHQP